MITGEYKRKVYPSWFGILPLGAVLCSQLSSLDVSATLTLSHYLLKGSKAEVSLVGIMSQLSNSKGVAGWHCFLPLNNASMCDAQCKVIPNLISAFLPGRLVSILVLKLLQFLFQVFDDSGLNEEVLIVQVL